MRSLFPVVLLLVLITVIAGRSSNSINVHDFDILKRPINNGLKDRTAHQPRNVLVLMLKIPSLLGGHLNLSVPWHSESESGICLKGSSGRGVGTVLVPTCHADEEVNGALCYPKCHDGYESVGCCICRQKGCPLGFKDDGVATCIKPEPYGRGTGYPWKFGDKLNEKEMYKRCEADHGVGNCEKSELIVYPKCKAGFHAVGCCICSPNCPDGMDDIGISCGKKSYGRGVGTSRLKCPGNKEEDAFLCYDKCQNGWSGVGPVCWKNCPSSAPIDCGFMCTVDEKTCVNKTLSIVKSAIEVGADIFVGISTSDVVKIIQAALKVAGTVADVMSNEYC